MYKVTFNYNKTVCTLLVDDVYVSEMMGFIQISGIDTDKSNLSESLKKEFADVSSSHIPINHVIKVDELLIKNSPLPPVKKESIKDGSNITIFPKGKDD